MVLKTKDRLQNVQMEGDLPDALHDSDMGPGLRRSL